MHHVPGYDAAGVAERNLVDKKLLNKMPPGDNSAPAELQSLMGKEYVFKLSQNKYNIVDDKSRESWAQEKART